MRCISVIALAAVASLAEACGPYPYDKTDIWFFSVTEETPANAGGTKQENLRLWQRETSPGIPLADIEEIVYGNFDAVSWEEGEVADSIRSNKFYQWLRSHQATEIQEFLTFAKRVERARAEKCSPWYYPAEKAQAGGAPSGFAPLIEQCAEQYGSKLSVRYGLQMIRLLHASSQWEACVAAYNRWFGDVPDNHLMKRMAMDYVAGAWTRLGDVDKANRYFAMKGDINSLNGVDALEYLAEFNPSAYPMQEIEDRLGLNKEPGCRHGVYSEEQIQRSVLPAARKVVKAGKAGNIGEWEFLLAYLEGEYNNDYKAADKYIRQALAHGLPTQTGRDHARAYKMAIDGARGNVRSLLADLKWLENKMKHEADAYLWRQLTLGIVYRYWFPYFTEHKHLPMALLLSNYVENLCGPYDYTEERLLTAQEKEQMRTSRKEHNSVDFNGNFVRYIMTLKPQDLIDYKHCLNDSSELVTYLRAGGRNDDDFLNELIGTLYLQDCNYIGAVNWLSKVSPNYQYTLNTYKGGYLTRDPFAFTPESRQDTVESAKLFPQLRDKGAVKLNFATRMCQLERQMKYGKDEHAKTVAKVQYTLARYASFSSCWALTAYEDGWVYPHHDFPCVESNRWDRQRAEEERKQHLIAETVASIHDNETAAEVQYLLGNLKTIAKKYPDTATGQFLSTHCDNWKDWYPADKGKTNLWAILLPAK